MITYLKPEDNPYHVLVCDITHKCNMKCANCYIPNRNIADMNNERLFEFLKRLPKRVEVRLMGGEPTVRKDLPYLINNIRKLGHRPTILTNGLKLHRKKYVEELYNAGLRSLNISMNGADDDSVYEVMDEMKCATKKIKAMENVASLGMYLNINCIIQKGVNEHVPERLISMCKEKNLNAVLRFRNVGQIGRYTLEREENYTFDDLVQLIANVTHKPIDWIREHHYVDGYNEEHNVLFPLEENKRRHTTWIKITDWSPPGETIPDPKSKRRGRITENFMVAPFFEHVKENEGGY